MSIYIGEPIVISDMQGPCPDGFHVPTSTEWESVKTIWTSLGGGGSDGIGFLTILKLPLSGAIEWNSGNISAQGIYGYYWSSSPYGSSKPTYASYLLIGASYILPTYDNPRSSGHSIRPFKNSSVIPTSSWTKLYGTSIESGGIFWNSIKGLISLSSNGSTWVTIADKNLGATTVWENGNTLSQNNCGYYYQRGNNYGFPFTGATSTSSTQVNAQNYGPGNYYSGSTFIKGNNDWSSVQNDNLRGGVSQGTSTKSVEVKNIYIGEYVPPVSLTFEYTGSDQNYTIPHDGNYKITAKGAGSRSAAGGLGEGVFSLTRGTVLSIMVGANGGNGNGVKYGFGGSANGGTNAAGGGLSGVFTGSGAITASDSARALVIGGGAGGSSAGTGGAGGGNNGGTGTGSYGTAGAGGTQTGHASGGNQGSYQFSGGNGSGTYGYGGGGGWRGGNGSIGDSSGDDDRGGGGGSGYVLSTASSRVLTQGGGSAAGHNGVVTIVEIR